MRIETRTEWNVEQLSMVNGGAHKEYDPETNTYRIVSDSGDTTYDGNLTEYMKKCQEMFANQN